MRIGKRMRERGRGREREKGGMKREKIETNRRGREEGRERERGEKIMNGAERR